MLLLKLTLIPASILLASLAARRFGHNVSGVVSGLPLIASPIIGLLLIEQPNDTVTGIADATLTSVPATFVFIVTYAWLARAGLRWWSCLGLAVAAFFASGALLLAIGGLPMQPPTSPSSSAQPPTPASLSMPLLTPLLTLLCPVLSLALMPRAVPVAPGGVRVPRSEIALRMVCALTVGALILLSAGRVPAALSGLLLAWPVTGSVLPSFTLPIHGRDATVNLLRGFATGLIGFVVFFNVLPLALRGGLDALTSFVASLAAAACAGWLLHRWRRRRDRRAPMSAR